MWDFAQGKGEHSEGWPPQDNGLSVGSVREGGQKSKCRWHLQWLDWYSAIDSRPGCSRSELQMTSGFGLAAVRWLTTGLFPQCASPLPLPHSELPLAPREVGTVSQTRASSVGDTASSLSALEGGWEDAVALRCTEPPPRQPNLKGPLDSRQGERELASFKTQLMGFLLLNVFHKWDLLAFWRFLF